ncbi:hypothetical protein [Metallosphaera sedula]|uniref:hypothetical protein n=1 Tax=Metallosphaera sedula TaxID=43687 RepID=UPI0020C123F7|nr:hypothetical protein [Metallosphaera sedula]BBL48320.1 hypothetical protein MJ1HA_2442 [Metallosphaera sedula]
MRKNFSARLMEVDTLDDPSVLNEQVFSFISLRHLLYLGGVGLFDYLLFSSRKPGGEVLGVILLAGAVLMAFYPTKATKIEAKVVGLLDYLITGEKVKTQEKEKKSKGKAETKEKRHEKREKRKLPGLRSVLEHSIFFLGGIILLVIASISGVETLSRLVVTVFAGSVGVALIVSEILSLRLKSLKRHKR